MLKKPKAYRWPLKVETLFNAHHLLHGTWKVTKIFSHFLHVTEISSTHVSQY